jgi:hypothetical protein
MKDMFIREINLEETRDVNMKGVNVNMYFKNILKKKLPTLILIFGIILTSMAFNPSYAEAEETPQETAITKASAWLKTNQNADGSWGKELAESVVITSHISGL